MSSAISPQSWAVSSRAPTHPFEPTYFGTKKRSGAEATRASCTPGPALNVIDRPSSLVMTKSLSRTRKEGAVCPPNGFSTTSGRSRQISRTRAAASSPFTTAPSLRSSPAHCARPAGDDVTADLGERRGSGQRHRDVELGADELDGLGHALLSTGTQSIDVGAAE